MTGYMFKKLKGIKKKSEVVFAPLSGKIVDIEKVPDSVFSDKLVGDGVAIIPDQGIVVAPVEGEVTQVFHTLHVIGVKSNQGLEIMIHIGLETVNLKGEGFNLHVKQGQKVHPGDKLLTFDIDKIKNKVPSLITPVIVLEGSAIAKLEKNVGTTAIPGSTTIFEITYQ